MAATQCIYTWLEERWLWKWPSCWCQTSDILETVDLLGFSRHNHLWNWPVTWEKIPRWCQRSQEHSQAALADRNATVTQITTKVCRRVKSECAACWTLKQMSCSSKRQCPCHFCHLRTGNWGYGSENWKNAPTRLNFCCNIWLMNETKQNMKAWIHLALYQRFRLLLVM